MNDVEIDIDFLLKQVTEHDDQEAFRHLFNYMYPPLVIFSKRYISSLAEREDIIQNVFCSIWINRKKINCNSSAKGYLVICAKNHCMNYLDKERTAENYEIYLKSRTPLYEEGNEKLYFLRELEQLLEELLSKLPEKQRLAFELTHLENKKKQEVAEQLNISTRTIERYNNQTIEYLKKHLKGYFYILFFLLN